jgi:hypothetical protein
MCFQGAQAATDATARFPKQEIIWNPGNQKREDFPSRAKIRFRSNEGAIGLDPVAI